MGSVLLSTAHKAHVLPPTVDTSADLGAHLGSSPTRPVPSRAFAWMAVGGSGSGSHAVGLGPATMLPEAATVMVTSTQPTFPATVGPSEHPCTPFLSSGPVPCSRLWLRCGPKPACAHPTPGRPTQLRAAGPWSGRRERPAGPSQPQTRLQDRLPRRGRRPPSRGQRGREHTATETGSPGSPCSAGNPTAGPTAQRTESQD